MKQRSAGKPDIELGKRMSNDLAACGVVAAVEPDLGSVGDISVQRPWREPLHASGPFGMGQPMLERAVGQRNAE